MGQLLEWKWNRCAGLPAWMGTMHPGTDGVECMGFGRFAHEDPLQPRPHKGGERTREARSRRTPSYNRTHHKGDGRTPAGAQPLPTSRKEGKRKGGPSEEQQKARKTRGATRASACAGLLKPAAVAWNLVHAFASLLEVEGVPDDWKSPLQQLLATTIGARSRSGQRYRLIRLAVCSTDAPPTTSPVGTKCRLRLAAQPALYRGRRWPWDGEDAPC